MKNRILLFLQIIFTIMSIVVVTVFANQAGTSEDPLVAKSYVDDKIEQVLKNIENIDNSSASYTPVYVEAGQTVIGEEGTEIILRSGKAKASIPGQDGLTNVTSGTNVSNNQDIHLNNLIIFPRSDQRGIKAVENSWFLIKGNYTIK